MSKRETILRSMETELNMQSDDPVDQILATISSIVDRTHQVALDQCKKAREAIEATSAAALKTIGLLEETIEVKRAGTTDQFREYLGSVRYAQTSAEEVHASAITAIAHVRESIGHVSEQVLRLPAANPKEPEQMRQQDVNDSMPEEILKV